MDEEDIVQSAFVDFYRAFQEGRLELENRENLLALLTTIIGFKAVNHVKRQLAGKRGGGRVQTGSVLDFVTGDPERDPVDATILADCYDHFVESLSESLRPFAELYLAGYTHEEIAQQMGCVTRTSERKVALAKEQWRKMAKQTLQEPDM